MMKYAASGTSVCSQAHQTYSGALDCKTTQLAYFTVSGRGQNTSTITLDSDV